jgi:hypothetical protein
VFKSLLDSTEQFPVDFDDAWQWVGYSTKGHAANALQSNFEEEVEFLRTIVKTYSSEGGRPFQQIKLTIDCFKAFCLMAGYFLVKWSRRMFRMVASSRLNVRSYPSASSASVSSKSSRGGAFSAGGRLPRWYATRQPGEQNRATRPRLAGSMTRGLPQASHWGLVGRSRFFDDVGIGQSVTYVTE